MLQRFLDRVGLSGLGGCIAAVCFLGHSMPAVSQDCPTQVLKIHQSPLKLYDTPVGGAPVGQAKAADLSGGGRVIDCHKGGRIKVDIGGQVAWVDLFAVQTDAVRRGPRGVDASTGRSRPGGGTPGGTAGISD